VVGGGGAIRMTMRVVQERNTTIMPVHREKVGKEEDHFRINRLKIEKKLDEERDRMG